MAPPGTAGAPKSASTPTRQPVAEGMRTGSTLRGKPFGRYRLLEELGHGGMGIVYLAWDTHLQREVALKAILSAGNETPQQVERFLREARAAARLKHPHIVPVYDVGIHEDQHYFTCEYIHGRTLSALQVEKPLPLKTALGLVRTVAEALQYAHDQGIVHRDVKPGNIMVDPGGRPFVMDFGLAKDVENLAAASGGESLTQSGALLGTPRYLSPEQAGGSHRKVGPAADQFSLGVVLYELVTQRPPFEAASLGALLSAIQSQDPARPARVNARLPRDVETVCLRALEKDPARRYTTMGEFADDLGRCLDGEPIRARAVSPVERLWRRAVRHGRVVFPLAAAVLAALGLGLWKGSDTLRRRGAIERHLNDGALAESKEDWPRARDAWQSVLALDDANPRAAAGLAKARERLSLLEAAEKKAVAAAQAKELAFARLEEGRRPLDQAARYLYNPQAEFDELQSRIGEGQKRIEEAVAAAPGLALGQYLLGRAWSLRGWDDRAEACWREAIRLDPKFGPAHYQLGRLLVVKAYLQSLGRTNEEQDRKAGAMAALVEEGRRELIAAGEGAGWDDAAERGLADGLLAYLRREQEVLRRIAGEGIRRLGQTQGAEEFHWLAAIAEPSGTARKDALDAALKIRPRYPLALLGRALERLREGDSEGALADCDAVLKIAPRLATALNTRGAVRVERAEWEDAIRDFNECLKLDPEDGLVYGNRAEVRHRLGDFEQARLDCEEGLKRCPGDPDLLLTRGNVRRDQGDRSGALADFSAAVDASPRFLAPRVNRGKLKMDDGDLAGALEDCEAALKIDGRCSPALVNRGALRQRQGDLVSAEADMEAAVQADPRNVDALVGRGTLRKIRKDRPGAQADFDAALKIDARCAGALYSRGTLRHDAGDLDGALADYEAVLRIDSRHAQALDARGLVREKRGDLEGALADFGEALGINPRFAEALDHRAKVRQAQGDLDGAMADYEAAVKAAPGWVGALNDRGIAHMLSGDLDAALADFNAVLKIDAKNAGALNNRGNVQRQKGDAEAALADFEAALRIAPDDPEILINRGMERESRQDLEGAMADYDAALVSNPSHIGALVNRANILHRQGDLDGAIAGYSAVLKVDEHVPEAWLNRAIAKKTKGDLAGAVADARRCLTSAPAWWPHRKAAEEALREFEAAAGKGSP